MIRSSVPNALPERNDALGVVMFGLHGIPNHEELSVDTLGKIKGNDVPVRFELNADRAGCFIERDFSHTSDVYSCGHGAALSNNSLIHPTRLASPRVTTANDCRKCNRANEALDCEWLS